MSHTIGIRRVVFTLMLAAALSVGLLAETGTGQAPLPAPAAAPAPTRPQAAPAPPAASSQEKSLVQLRVQVTITRYTGDKKTASLPFTLWVSVDGEPTILNAGQQVPTPQGPDSVNWTYQRVGTSIVCRATPYADGRFRVNLSVRDSSLAPAKTSSEGVTMKSLEANNWLLLRDGQNAEFAASTDMITGEVTRIDVTATVLK